MKTPSSWPGSDTVSGFVRTPRIQFVAVRWGLSLPSRHRGLVFGISACHCHWVRSGNVSKLV